MQIRAIKIGVCVAVLLLGVALLDGPLKPLVPTCPVTFGFCVNR